MKSADWRVWREECAVRCFGPLWFQACCVPKGVGAPSDLRREKSCPAGSSSLVETLPASLAAQHTLTKNEMPFGGGVVLRVCLVHGAARHVECLYSCSEISCYRKIVPV